MAKAVTNVIEFPRGDLFAFPLTVILDDANGPTDADFIWFTVKKYYEDTEVIFQKTLQDGNIIRVNEGHYVIRIEPEDTETLDFGQYDFDIQCMKGEFPVQFKNTIYGHMILTAEVTHKGDEDHGGTPVPTVWAHGQDF